MCAVRVTKSAVTGSKRCGDQEDFRKILHEGQRMVWSKWRRNIAENFNLLSRVHEPYRQTADRQTDELQWQIPERDIRGKNSSHKMVHSSISHH